MSPEPKAPERDLLDRVARELRRPVALDDGLEARVLHAIAAGRWRPALVWRIAALAAALLIAAGIAVRVGRSSGAAPAVATASAAQPVRFELVAPASSRVTVVGDFNDWDPRASPMVRAGAHGAWSLRLALPPGRYRYSYLVDGTRWVPDPSEPPTVGDDFDTPTSVITVTGGAL
jgi:hypothetical protein